MDVRKCCERAFTLAETARVARVPESTIRTWLARTESGFGEKRRGRILFSMTDMLGLRLAGELVGCGHEPQRAMWTAEAMAVTACDPDDVAFVQGADVKIRKAGEFPPVDRTTVVIPIGRMAADTFAEASALYETPAG